MKNFTKTSFLLILTLCVTCLGGVRAQTLPRLDNTFGTGGVIRPSFGGNPAGFKHITPTPDGGFFATGYVRKLPGIVYQNDMLTAKFLNNGNLDLSFVASNAGYDITNLANSDDWGSASFVRPDGKIIAIGSSHTPNTDWTRAITALVNPNGTQDASWNNNVGIGYISSATTNLNPRVGKLLPNGKLVIALSNHEEEDSYNWRYYEPNYACYVSKINSDGTKDVTFGQNGLASFVAARGTSTSKHYLTGMDVQADGKIVICGYLGTSGSKVLYFLGRLTEFGTLDASFGVNGFTTSLGTTDTITPRGVMVQPDGKILMYSTLSENRLHLSRFNSDGMLDLGFNGMGYLVEPASNNGLIARTALLEPNGKILIGGHGLDISNNNYARITKGIKLRRYLSNGQLDNSFAANGQFSLFNTDSLRLYSMCFTPDNKLMLAGYFSTNPNSGTSSGRLKEGFLMRLSDLGLANEQVESEGLEAYVFPSLVTDNKIICRFEQNYKDLTSIELIDTKGELVKTYHTDWLNESRVELTLPESMPWGVYYLRLKSSSKHKTLRFLKI